MTIGDTPHISASTYTSNTYVPDHVGWIGGAGGGGGWVDTGTTAGNMDQYRGIAAQNTSVARIIRTYQDSQEDTEDMAEQKKVTARLVRVVIADADENLPIQDRLIYKGDEQFTDLNDQELFFELDIKTLLAAHNEKRVKVVNKQVKDRTEHLEAAKIRDLRMVVVTVASF